MPTSFKFDAVLVFWWIAKDPEAILDYTLDWATWLGADTIVGAPTWTVPPGITKNSQTNTTTTATVWLSGGAANNDYTIECKIVTAGGRTDERSFIIRSCER